jgi:hypothetical protein
MADPRHPDHHRLLERRGDPNDPEGIDFTEINTMLKSVRA